MANQTNYRIKVDLSRYYDDVRRLSCIYIDTNRLKTIDAVKQHIVHTFDIRDTESFDLLLNGNEYLPPKENVRIVNQDDVIVAVPNLGIYHANNSVTSDLDSSISPIKLNGFNPRYHEMQYNSDVTRSNVASKTVNQRANVEQNENQSVGSSVTEVSIATGTSLSESINGSMSNIAATNGNTIEPNEAARKRKRTRRKRTKKQAEILEPEVPVCQPRNEKKPKITNTRIIPIGKHIRFNILDDDVANVSENAEPKSENLPPTNKHTDQNQSNNTFSPHADSLATLLSMGLCSPRTFVKNKKANNKTVNDGIPEQSSENNIKKEVIESPKSVTLKESGGIAAIDTTAEPKDYSQLNPEEYPVFKQSPALNDIIAFKMLKMESDYTPGVSNYIIARTVGWTPETQLYTFEILRGSEELQTPLGKFTLPDDEFEEPVKESYTTKLNLVQLMEPRLIYRQ